MTEYYYQIKCRYLEDFLQQVKELKLVKSKPSDGDQWVFKGLKNAKWNLKTTLERAFEQFGVFAVKEKDEEITEKQKEEQKKERKIKIEKAMIREFQRRLHHYTSNVPGEDEFDEWMALMRHYGGPSRLLDFTYSPYVAAYFAFEDACSNSEVAIWAVNNSWCRKVLKSRCFSLYSHYRLYEKHRRQEGFKKIFMSTPQNRLVLGVNPYRLNERLASQKGVFLCPGDPTVSFMDNLSEFIENNEVYNELYRKVIKFTIPTGENGEIRDDALWSLEYMNINRITLFPGLDGFAQSFKPRIPWFRSIDWGDFRAR